MAHVSRCSTEDRVVDGDNNKNSAELFVCPLLEIVSIIIVSEVIVGGAKVFYKLLSKGCIIGLSGR